MDEKKDFLQKTTEDVLGRLGVTANVAVSLEEGPRYFLDIDGSDLGALIGYHGEALGSLQLILSLAFYRHFNEWVPLSVDVDGYRREREEKLKALTQRSIDKVRFLSRAVSLPPLPSYERRLVHLYASEFSDIASVSEGEGRDRHVVLQLRAAGEDKVKEADKKDTGESLSVAKDLVESQ